VHACDAPTAELAPFTGEGGRPIYVAADGVVFNMSSHEGGPAFYGPGGGYNVFAGRCVLHVRALGRPGHCACTRRPIRIPPLPPGRGPRFARSDASIGLATMQTDPKLWAKKTVAELTASEKDTLADWVRRFSMKYEVVGYLNDGAHPKTVAGEAASGGQ
jgi:hypothetical protein